MSSFSPPLPQTKQKWTAAPAPRTRSSTTCWSSCSLATARWRSESPAPSASTTTSSWSSSADTPPASTAVPRSRPAPSAGRPSASGSSYLSEHLCPFCCYRPKQDVGGGWREARVEGGRGYIFENLETYICLSHPPASPPHTQWSNTHSAHRLLYYKTLCYIAESLLFVTFRVFPHLSRNVTWCSASELTLRRAWREADEGGVARWCFRFE